MSILNDPMLALIARFVGADLAHLDFSNENCLRHQVAEIMVHIETFPEPQRQQAALDWIKDHAEQFRRHWHKRTLSQSLVDRRCDDCPLVGGTSEVSCTIHKQWVGLLNVYVAGTIGSDRFVEETLQLLHEHKDELRVSDISQRLRHPAITPVNQRNV